MVVESITEPVYGVSASMNWGGGGGQALYLNSLRTIDKSNLDLMARNSSAREEEEMSKQGRSLKIKIHYCYNPVINLNNVLMKLQLHRTPLYGLPTLHIELSSQENMPMYNPFVGGELDRIQMQTAALQLLTPQVRSLKTTLSSATDTVSHTTAMALVANYAHQLSAIDSNMYTLASVSSRLPQSMERMTLLCDCNSYAVLPRVSTSSLKSLSLLCVSHSMPWDWLVNGKAHIGFDSLENLSVKIIVKSPSNQFDAHSLWVGPHDRLNYTVSAPSLQCLSIEACAFSFSLVWRILESCGEIKRLQINLETHNVIRLHRVKPSAQFRRVVFKHSQAVMSIVDAVDLANDVFSIPNLADGLEFQLSQFSSQLDVTTTCWTFLKSLTIYKDIAFDDILTMLQRMTSLLVIDARNVSVSAQKSTLSTMANDSSISRSNSEPLLSPTYHWSSLRVASIKLQHDCNDVASRLYVKSHLLFSIKTLEHILVY
ncbi:hypothetical protein H4217_000145 [Coemansia sp. RSA 1939]|nr:hypothetical protein H4217_000145 [Coemansia sp. RSA 1939]KAJ2617956.1 hypothetical protein EV177_000266 [Coemansia sp. RSA 1804]